MRLEIIHGIAEPPRQQGGDDIETFECRLDDLRESRERFVRFARRRCGCQFAVVRLNESDALQERKVFPAFVGYFPGGPWEEEFGLKTGIEQQAMIGKLVRADTLPAANEPGDEGRQCEDMSDIVPVPGEQYGEIGRRAKNITERSCLPVYSRHPLGLADDVRQRQPGDMQLFAIGNVSRH